MTDAAPHLDPTDTGPASPAGERLSRANEVSDELEAIFGEPAATEGRAIAPSPPRPQPQLRRTTSRRAPGGVTLTSVGGVLAAALVGVAAGSLIARAQHAQHARPIAVASVAPPPQPANLPVQTLPPAQPPQAVEAALTTAPVVQDAPVKAAPNPQVVRTHARATHRPKATRACCSYADAQAADRRLRAAYADAVRAGVSRSEIIAARDRWYTARRNAGRDPARVVASYGDIADDLNRASRRARTYARADSGRFHPRYAAWWR